jgi:putative ABC transport system permease protein
MMYENHMAEIFERMGINIRYEVLPVTYIHLHSDFEGEPVPVGNINYVYIFIAIIILLLLIASMNYMNLATARSTKRAKEIGIRKVAGSSRAILVRQFLIESLVLAVLSLIISLALCYFLMPAFNNISGKAIDMGSLLNPSILLIMAGIVIVTGLLGGSYPAVFLSAFNPTEVLKGELHIGGSNLNIRKILTVAQFSLSTFLVISTWIVYDQLHYLKNMDMGFNKENVLVLSLNNQEMVDKLPVLKQDLLANPSILSAGSANTRIGQGSSKTIMRVETDDGMVERGINNMQVDHDFIDAVGIRLLEGRGFSEQFPADTARGVIINQTLAKRLNWDEPIGKKVNLPGDTLTIATVVGLIGDYHQFGLYNVMEDQMFLYYPRCFRVFIRYSGEHTASTLEYIEETWNKLFPEIPFEYYFLDEDFGEQFQADEKRGIVFTFFSILTVVIACLGLYGLSSFVSELRTKEIGIRKVHGASVNSITGLFLGSYLILVAIAIVIASAGAYFFAGEWLESFVYRTDIRWATFFLAALLTIAVTILTVSFHTIRASQVNPAESLRDE